MNRTVLTTLTYYVAGSALCVSLALRFHLGLVFLGGVLPLLYVGHVCWNMVQSEFSKHSPICLVCETGLSFFGRVWNKRFCCDDHHNQWLRQAETAAIERLQAAVSSTAPVEVKATHRREPESQPDEALPTAVWGFMAARLEGRSDHQY